MHKVIHPKYLPNNPPVVLTLLAWLILEHFHYEGWGCWVLYGLIAVRWVTYFFCLGRDHNVHPRDL